MARVPRVLVIDEDPAVRVLLRRTLGSAGYRTREMALDHGALGCLAERAFDLAIIDVDAGPGCGVELIRLVRDFSPMPILALSARTDEDITVEALDSGADDLV